MKTSLVLFVAFFTSNVFAADCKLEKPIPLSNDPLTRQVVLKDARVDALPKFTEPEKYQPATDALEVRLFQVERNNEPTGYVGVRVSVVGKLESVGFSNGYNGNVDPGLRGSVHGRDGERVYVLRQVSRYTDPQHAKNEAVHESRITVMGNEITSVQLTFPVFRVWHRVDHMTYVAFTGEHQTLCVTSAR